MFFLGVLPDKAEYAWGMGDSTPVVIWGTIGPLHISDCNQSFLFTYPLGSKIAFDSHSTPPRYRSYGHNKTQGEKAYADVQLEKILSLHLHLDAISSLHAHHAGRTFTISEQ